MSTRINLEKPTQAEIEKIIHQAHQMRSEYLAKSIKAGLSNLRGFLTHQKPADNATA